MRHTTNYQVMHLPVAYCKYIVVLLCSNVAIAILRSSCKMSANFNIMLQGMTDTGVVETTRKAKSQRQCVLQCASVLQCKSLNYRQTQGQCELLGRTLRESIPFLQKQSDSIYLTTDDLALNVSSQVNNYAFSFFLGPPFLNVNQSYGIQINFSFQCKFLLIPARTQM